ncbi:MAG: hypothetical protein WD648_05415, partial [Planctomycetaceae bacterium]
ITFGVLAVAFCLRSFALCMTFTRKGPIWQDLPSGRAIVFDTTWGPYFLVPLGLAILLLLLEMGLVAKSQRFLQNVMAAAPALLLLSSPLGGGPVFRGFLSTFTETVGSPVWLTVWTLLGFYCWSWLRGVAQARFGVIGALGLLSVVGARTIDLRTFIQPQPQPFLVIGAILLANGLWARSSRAMAAAAVAAVFGLWLMLPQSISVDYRVAVCFNVLLAAIVAVGLAYRDRFAGVLRSAGALLILFATIVVTTSSQAADVPLLWRTLYVGLLVVASLCIAMLWGDRWYLRAFAGSLLVAAYGGIAVAFRSAAGVIGRPALTAFSWSLGALLLAFLISAHKARWLPRRLLPGWSNGHNGNGSQKTSPPAAPPVTNGLSSDTPT